MKQETLSAVCDINPAIDSGISDDVPCSFVPMERVDEVSGTIARVDIRRVGEVKRGYTFFRDGDVIFAKITPCMENGKCAIATSLTNGIAFGSTEFHVVRARESIIPEWIYYYLRQERIRKEAAHWFHGTAGQQRVPSDFLENLTIPLPPLDEQRRIAALLARADRLRRLRRYTRQLGESLLQSVFLEMFGSPLINPMNWDVVELSEMGTLDRGRSQHRPRNAPELYGGSYPFVQTGDIANADGYLRSYQQTYSEAGLEQSKLWPAGTLCITIAANIARTAIMAFDACFPDSVVGFIPGKSTNVEYVQFWLSFKQKELEETAPESAQKNINLEILRGLQIPLPPMSLQDRFANIVSDVERLRSRQREAERQVEELFQSLLAQAFDGSRLQSAR